MTPDTLSGRTARGLNASAHLHHPPPPGTDVPDEPGPGALPVEPDEGPVPASLPDDPEHGRIVDPAAFQDRP